MENSFNKAEFHFLDYPPKKGYLFTFYYHENELFSRSVINPPSITN